MRPQAKTPDTQYVTYIASTAEKVWEALTDPAATKQYFLGRRVESTWKVGALVVYWMEDGRVDVQGRVIQADRPRRLSFTWHVERLEELRRLPESHVTFQIDQLDHAGSDVVRVTITESHPEPIPEKYLEGGRKGWPVILSGMKTLLETGRAIPAFDWSA